MIIELHVDMVVVNVEFERAEGTLIIVVRDIVSGYSQRHCKRCWQTASPVRRLSIYVKRVTM